MITFAPLLISLTMSGLTLTTTWMRLLVSRLQFSLRMRSFSSADLTRGDSDTESSDSGGGDALLEGDEERKGVTECMGTIWPELGVEFGRRFYQGLMPTIYLGNYSAFCTFWLTKKGLPIHCQFCLPLRITPRSALFLPLCSRPHCRARPPAGASSRSRTWTATAPATRRPRTKGGRGCQAQAWKKENKMG